MSDCIQALITQNLVAALDAKTFVIGGVSHTSKCEQARSVYNSNGSTCYIELSGPWGTSEHENNRSDHVELNYVAEMHIPDINDSATDSEPITEQTENVGADMIKNVMTDFTRGGYALITRAEGTPGYYFTGSPEAPEFVVYVHFSVEAFINADNPYANG